MAVRLRSPPAIWPRLRPLSWRACFTLPARISTPRRRPRRRFGIEGCADSSDIAVSLTRASRHLTGLTRSQQQWKPPPSAAADRAVAKSVIAANRVAKNSLRIKDHLLCLPASGLDELGGKRRY